jgi:hypothetical protein
VGAVVLAALLIALAPSARSDDVAAPYDYGSGMVDRNSGLMVTVGGAAAGTADAVLGIRRRVPAGTIRVFAEYDGVRVSADQDARLCVRVMGADGYCDALQSQVAAGGPHGTIEMSTPVAATGVVGIEVYLVAPSPARTGLTLSIIRLTHIAYFVTPAPTAEPTAAPPTATPAPPTGSPPPPSSTNPPPTASPAPPSATASPAARTTLPTL